MNKNLYYDGRQIKNYIIGFASLFSEIPFQDRNGKIKTVPIYYGSLSDVVSHLDLNVDNDATSNVNRLKDLTVPLFSFRMIGLERNVEKRRSPHDKVTVDLRQLGYNVGYVTMFPAPYKFTMELTCWASSDYQAFEITEQIIPYFNSPQQVKIEPLPRSPVSTTEVFLDSIEIDTDPESQTSTTVTMTFTLTGYILTQPKLWQTDLKFELNMLDTKHEPLFKDDKYSFGKEIKDFNDDDMPKQKQNTLSSLENFVKSNNAIMERFGDALEIYKILIKNGRVKDNG